MVKKPLYNNAGQAQEIASTDTIPAANLPVMVGSGTGHAAGAVPDPGSSAGTTKYLREDGSWNVPAGTGGGGGSLASDSVETFASTFIASRLF